MKSPRTLLSELEEVGCRLAEVVGTRSGELLLNPEPKPNLVLAKRLRELEWPIKEMTTAMHLLASRIERRFCPGPVKMDRDGYFLNAEGKLVRTKETEALAKAYYETGAV